MSLPTKIADHLPIFQITKLGKVKSNNINHKKLSSKALQNLSSILQEVDIYDILIEEDIDIAVDKLYFHLSEAIDSVTPPSSTKPKASNPKWYDKEVRKLKTKKESAYKKYLSNKNSVTKTLSTQAKNNYFFTLKRKRENYFLDLFHQHRKNSKETWKVINSLLGKSKSKNSCSSLKDDHREIHDPTEVSNKFNHYFANVAHEIRKSIPSNTSDLTDHIQPRGSQSSSSAFFSMTSESEVSALVKKLKPKSSFGIDGISTDIVKALPPNILSAITHIFNQSLDKGYFPTKFKTAKVIPIYKKKGSRSSVENYRPISLLSCLSKVLEKIVSKRMVSFLHKKNFFSKYQFGFRKGLSTSHAISLLVNKITEAMNRKEKTLGIFLDFSKAFDLMDHDILLKKLNSCGIRGIANDWIKSYLTGRKQLVFNNGHWSSTILDITIGTPQRSILGPLLFIIYINDLPNCLEFSSPVLYADDSNLLISHNDPQELIRRGNIDLINVRNWLNKNKLSLNTSKTQAVIFRTPNTTIPGNLNSLKLDANVIEISDKTEFLGTTITKSLSWNPHMKNLKSTLRRNLGVCRKIRSHVGQDAMLKLYHSLIESRITYALTTWCFEILY